MTEIERIKQRNEQFKQLQNNVSPSMFELKEVTRNVTTDIDSLLTTIESQKETIDEQYHTISTANIWNSKLKDEIESLKAITELAVKGLQMLKAMSSKDDIAPALYNSASWYLQEIEKLQK